MSEGPRTVAVDRPEPRAVGEETVLRLDDAEFVPLRVCEHDMGVIGLLADVDVVCAEGEQFGDRVVLLVG